METQTCSSCLSQKPLTDYTQRKRECRECRNKKAKEFYIANREKCIIDSQLWKLNNEEKLCREVKCECGSEVQCRNFKEHEKSVIHQNFINGIKKETKDIISYYDEENSFKRKFIKVNTEVYKTFKSNQSRALCSNYKLLRQMSLI